MTNMYQLTGQVPLHEHQLKSTGHCIRMPAEERSNDVTHSEIWWESSRSQRDKKDVSEQIWVELTFLSYLRRKKLRTYLLSPYDDDEVNSTLNNKAKTCLHIVSKWIVIYFLIISLILHSTMNKLFYKIVSYKVLFIGRSTIFWLI